MLLDSVNIRKAFDFLGPWQAFRSHGDEVAGQVTAGALVIGPNSVDVTLAPEIVVIHGGAVLDPARSPVLPRTSEWMCDSAEGYALAPGECALAATRERFSCSAPLVIDGREEYFVQHYDGRSTVGRLFLASHVTAAFGDYGFAGHWTLELVNHSPCHITLRAGMRIGQVFFTRLTGKPERPYTGAYAEQYHRPSPQMPSIGHGRF